MLCHSPDLIQAFFSTVELCSYRDIHILVTGFENNFARNALWYICKMNCTARTFASFLIRLPAVITVYRIDGLFQGFSTTDLHRLVSIGKLRLQNRIQLCLKFIECSAIVFCNTDWFIHFLVVFPDRRILLRSGKIFAPSCRNRFLVIILCHPSLVRTDHISFYINTWKRLDTACVDCNRYLARTTGDLLPKRIFLFSCQHMTDCIGVHRKRSLRFQMISPAKSYSITESFTLPESRPPIASLHTAEVLLHPMI